MNNADHYRVRVSAAVLRAGDELLTVRESRRAITVTNLPGGVPKLDETLEEAVIREVREETGYDVIPTEIAFVAERRLDRWTQSVLEICFYARLLSSERHELMHSDNVHSAEWLALDHLDVRRHMPFAELFAESKRGRYMDMASKVRDVTASQTRAMVE